MKGSFKKMASGKWSFTIDVGIDPKTGRRKQARRSGFKTKKEAQEMAAKIQYELSEGTYVKEKSILFKEFAEQWLGIYSKRNEVKPATIRVRTHEMNRLNDRLGNVKINKVTRNMYQSVLDDLKAKGYKDNTLNGIHNTGRMIFKKAVELEVIKRDPTEYTYLQKTKKSVEELEQQEIPKYLEKEELAAFLKTAENEGLEMDDVIFTTLAYSGLRVGELIALKWKDINFDDSTINVTKTYYNPTNHTTKFSLVTPKNKMSKRKIVMDDYMMDKLKRHSFIQNELKMLYRDTYNDQGFVFAKVDKNPGYPLVVKRIETRMKRLLKLTGHNQQLTPHSLRHTHTSLLAEAGVGLELIMERLGHSDDKTTRDVYLHVTKEAKKEASHKFGELMKSLMK